MFVKRIATILAVVLAIAGLYAWHGLSISTEDRLSYRQLMESSRFIKHIPKIDTFQTKQKRLQVSKQILFKEKKGQRPQLFLRSDSSDIVFQHTIDQMVMLERFHNLTCSIQEELEDQETPKQFIRHIEAKAATYCYSSHELLADNASLSRYFIEGHQLPLSFEEWHPLMKGIAQTVRLSLSEKPVLKAQGFKATFGEKEVIQ